MIKLEMTYNEAYHMIKLYDLLRDMDMLDDLPGCIETFFDKIQSEQVNYTNKVSIAQSKQPIAEW